MIRKEAINRICTKLLGWHRKEKSWIDYGYWFIQGNGRRKIPVRSLGFNPFESPKDCEVVMDMIYTLRLETKATTSYQGSEVSITTIDLDPEIKGHGFGGTEYEAKMNAVLEMIGESK